MVKILTAKSKVFLCSTVQCTERFCEKKKTLSLAQYDHPVMAGKRLT